ncbi:hypothetical protein DPMN_001460, partial [Dreissena polymorpha]
NCENEAGPFEEELRHVGTGNDFDNDSLSMEEDNTQDHTAKLRENLRTQIAAMCEQLSELGEECMFLSLNPADKVCQHTGSMKGDQFCLLRPGLVKDFTNFCQAYENPGMGNTVDDTSLFPDEMEGMSDHMQQDSEVEHSLPETPEKTTPIAVKPKIIVIRKSQKEGGEKVTAPTPSVVTIRPLPSTDHDDDGDDQGGDEAQSLSEKENQQTGPNILFLCEICKAVFNNVQLLRSHKKSDHNETDYVCEKCSRVFTQQRALSRHMEDAHDKHDRRFLCDTCVREFKSSKDLSVHIADCHNSTLAMKCDVCEQMFEDIGDLMNHRKIHFDYACFCTKCWQGFFDYLELETHISQNCRYREALYKCTICGKKFTKLNLISKHIDTHPVHAPHVCRMCGRGFTTERDLKNHRVAAHIIRPYKCELCEKTFKKKEALVEHRRIHLRVKFPGGLSLAEFSALLSDEKSTDAIQDEATESVEMKTEFACTLCGICLASQGQLDQHMHRHEVTEEHYKCDHCDKVFFALSLLTVHARRDHKIIVGTKDSSSAVMGNVCQWEGCSKVFYDRLKLRQHMKYHEQRADKIARGIPVTQGKTPTMCNICGQVLKYRSYLKAHMLNHQEADKVTCEVCGETFPDSKQLTDHKRSQHQTGKPFKCQYCDKQFGSNALCKQHMLIHTGLKKYVCDVCGKGFMSRKHFHDHLRLHNGEQQYRCDLCGKEFIYFRSLVRHKQVHVDPKERLKPYKCEFCGKEYTEVTGYKHHMRSVHTGENPFQCDLCGESFHRNDKLKRHLKTRHHCKANESLMVTTRRQSEGGPIIVKAETIEGNHNMFQIVHGDEDSGVRQLHVDVVQDENGVVGTQQVYLIGLGNQEGGETAYLQETQVIEGPDGVRYIIAGSGEELQVIESHSLQQLEDGSIVAGTIQEEDEDMVIMNDGSILTPSQETLTTLANMAEIVQHH